MKDRTVWCPTVDASEVNNLYRPNFQVLPSSSLSLPSSSLSLFLSCVCGETPSLSTRPSTIVRSMKSSTLTYLSRLRQQIKWKQNGHKCKCIHTNIRLKKTPVFVTWWFGVLVCVHARVTWTHSLPLLSLKFVGQAYYKFALDVCKSRLKSRTTSVRQAWDSP